MAARHHQEIEDIPERINLLQHYGGRYKWQRLEVSFSIQIIRNFVRRNPKIAVNLLLAVCCAILTCKIMREQQYWEKYGSIVT